MNLSPDIQPIHVVRRTKRPCGYRLLVGALVAVVGAICALLVMSEGMPPIGLLIILGILVVATENRDRLFGDETSISTSMVVATAAIVAFSDTTPLLGPMICASCAGLYWPHLRQRSIAKALVNASAIGLSALVGAALFGLLNPDRHGSVEQLIALLVPVVLAYWLVNTLLLAGALAVLRGADFERTLRLLVVSETPLLAFAVLGGLCGFAFVNKGHWFGVASLLACAALADFVMISSHRWPTRVGLVRQSIGRLGCPCVASLLGGLVTARWSVMAAVGWVLIGAPVLTYATALVRVHHRTRRWDAQLASGVAILDLPVIFVCALIGAVTEAAGIWVGVLILGVAVCVMFAVSRVLRQREVEARADDERIAAAVERAVLEGRSLPTSFG